ncbi:hypothetical protein [Saccharibacillus sp. JS10]|uniref:hypothetical protein n=1 Tax=Saccharibacillus sp. JS10 TaxID=2950552 RepID=UPI00210F18F0|nr:hypothetical protein [Saccharibacillus sp. JS10]MCQ4086624.1 hypothetical protein [Saccharibacillus sp. JS10]
MNWYTFGQMLNIIQLGQIAEAADRQRQMRLLPQGLVWVNGPYRDRIVQVQDYLLSDLWHIVEDEDSKSWIEKRAEWERKRIEMLESQLFEQRAQRFEPSNLPE